MLRAPKCLGPVARNSRDELLTGTGNKKLYKDVYLSSMRPVIAAGKYDAVMLAYAAQYEAIGKELVISVIEVHLPIRQRTYKFGCSTGGELDDLFKSSVESFIRSFQLIPIEH